MGSLSERPVAHPIHPKIAKVAKYERRKFRKFSTWKQILVSITAYVIGPGQPCANYPGKTATGTQVTTRTAAVDPSFIRLGTTLKIPGMGLYTAQDTGSGIVGNRVDLAVWSCREAFDWGRRSMVISYKA